MKILDIQLLLLIWIKEVVKDSNSVLNFSSLNETINSNSSSEIKLDNDYLYDDTTDSRFISLGGIVINRNLTIDGQGHTIDLAGKVDSLMSLVIL